MKRVLRNHLDLRADTTAMTQPRMRIPGATVHVTRTVSERRFLLLPLGPINETFLYCFFRAALKHRILLHSLFVHRNHYHAVVSDPLGVLSDFTHDVHLTVARCLLPYYRLLRPDVHLEALWANAKTNEVILDQHNAILDALVYDITNPVRDGIVYRHQDWPGLLLGPREWMLPPRIVKRPDNFFVEDGIAPETVQCHVVPPTQFCDRSTDRLAADPKALVADEESAIRATMRENKRSFLGADKMLRDDPFDAPRAQRSRSRVTPTVATGGDPKAFKNAIAHVHRFRARYRECFAEVRKRLASGDYAVRDIIFPFGTLLMRTRHGFRCEDPIDTWCLLAHTPP